MSTQDIANDLVALCKAGKLDEAGEKYWVGAERSSAPTLFVRPAACRRRR